MPAWQPPETEDLRHPEAAIRLASVVHRFPTPTMSKTRGVSFARSFQTVGRHGKTTAGMSKADEARTELDVALSLPNGPSQRIIDAAQKYQPCVHQILLSCKVQPESARLDDRLVFEWASGIESDRAKMYKSEAIMYDLVMCLVSEGLARSGAASDERLKGDFAAASREYAATAGLWKFLAEDHLPKWTSTNVDEDDLPAECSVGVARSLQLLSQAHAQQMAVATVLRKPESPNYSLLAKLCLGVAEQLEEFQKCAKVECVRMTPRMNQDVFALVDFEIKVHRGLSGYFYARAQYEQSREYGLGIALLREAIGMLSKGLPDVSKSALLKTHKQDIKDLQKHLQVLLKAWERDNGSVFFEPVPNVVSSDKKLRQGVKLNKCEPYVTAKVEPLYLQVPEPTKITSRFFGSSKKKPAPVERSDSDITRELSDRMKTVMSS